LRDAAGEEVPLTVTDTQSGNLVCSRILELKPSVELEPREQYTLVDLTSESRENPPTEGALVTFTTGDGPLDGKGLLAPAPFELLAFQMPVKPAPPPRTSCDPPAGLPENAPTVLKRVCVLSKDAGTFEVAVSNDENNWRTTVEADGAFDIAIPDDEGRVCVTLKRRDAAGNLSPASETCMDVSGSPNTAGPVAFPDGEAIDCDSDTFRAWHDVASQANDAAEASGHSPAAPSDGGAVEPTTRAGGENPSESSSAGGCSLGSLQRGSSPARFGVFLSLCAAVFWRRKWGFSVSVASRSPRARIVRKNSFRLGGPAS
jgi:hypothetical protein